MDIDCPEYLSLFQAGGEYRVQVKFKDFDGKVADSSMRAAEILKLVDPKTGSYYAKMYFDDWLFDVYKYEIDPVKRLLTIRARQCSK